MALLGQWMVLLHVIAAFALVSGLVGREYTRAYARHQTQVEPFKQLMGLSRWFETKLLNPASHVILLFGLGAAWTRGWPILGVLQGSSVNWVFISLLLYLTLIPVVFILIPRNKIVRQKLAALDAQEHIAPELHATLEDPVVRAIHIYELVIVGVIIYLMVMKPF